MKKRRLGRSGPEVFGAGARVRGMSAGYGPPADKQEMIALIIDRQSVRVLQETVLTLPTRDQDF
jgi:hypothetical protein